MNEPLTIPPELAPHARGACRAPTFPEKEPNPMAHEPLHTMGQQHGRRSWAEPWKIKMVEPLTVTTREQREAAL
ncbi:MAG TPA: hypothetical protein VER83_04085, partial [Candidatus Nanopelagicales bacterium]|nr:hypothetical protein [Candidatus Nanopelagicales bacterium]